jgi:ABC-type bacteriocin/lantibiotic exporter with double-glycine peptidase domain
MTTSIKNLLLIQIYGIQAVEEKKALKSLTWYHDHYVNFLKAAGLKFISPQIFGIGIVCLIALEARSYGKIAPGTLVSYFYVFFRFVQNLSEVTKTSANLILYWPQLQDLSAWWKVADPLIRRENESRRTQKTFAAPPSQAFSWAIRNVSFSYPASDVVVLRDISLDVKAGQALVILGPSGAGKSTLMNLLLGNLAPTRGEIAVRWDEKVYGIREVKTSLLQHVGYVGPESFLIEGSLHTNLVYGLPFQPSDHQLRDALELAECNFVYSFPEGLEKKLTEQGHGLSAGQKQRLSLARALLRAPKALFLDEATSNLDRETEAKLIQTFARLKSKMTLIIVTHRHSLLEIADQELRLS